MSDQFAQTATGMTGPGRNAFEITPDDDADLAYVTRGIYVGVSGNIKVDMAGGETVTFTSLVAGIVHPLRIKRVHETDTTATGIIGLY